MYDPVSVDDRFTFATVLNMLLFDCVFYALLVLYLDAVIPNEFGVQQPWYFVLRPSFWTTLATDAMSCCGLRANRGSTGTHGYVRC